MSNILKAGKSRENAGSHAADPCDISLDLRGPDFIFRANTIVRRSARPILLKVCVDFRKNREN